MNLSDTNVLVISGPSGSGKGTLINKCLLENENIEIAISATTRPPRNSEVNGRDYYFLSNEEFDIHVKNDNFVEYCNVHTARYGTLKQELFRINQSNKIVMLEIDTMGVQKIKPILKNATYVFIAAPDLNELENRLILRKTETKSQIKTRLNTAREELKRIELYDYVIINGIIEDAYFELSKIIKNSYISRGKHNE